MIGNSAVSIVTVTYNAEGSIRGTIESVASQTFSDYEYIIIDGLSKDRTVSIAEQYSEQFKRGNITYKIVSENDTGIYNAMNKAYQYCSGDYILFLNAGDKLCDSDALKNLWIKVGKNPFADIIYADTIEKHMNLYRYAVGEDICVINEKMPFCHQSVLTARELFKDDKYNENYKICADYDFYLRKYLERKRFVYVGIPLSIYDMNGVSSSDDSYAFFYERIKIRYETSVINKKEFETEVKRLIYRKKKRIIINMIKKIIPNNILRHRKIRQLKQRGWKEWEEIT